MMSLLLFYFSVLPDADKNGKSYATFRKSEQKKRCPAFHLLGAPLRALVMDKKGTPVHTNAYCPSTAIHNFEN